MDPIECSDMCMLHMILNLNYSHEWGRATAKKWEPEDGVKIQYTLMKKTISMTFIPTLCVFLHIKDIKYIERDFWSDTWAMPERWDLGAQDLIVFNMVMLHINLTEMISRTERK